MLTNNDISRYFKAEKSESLLFIVAGAAAVLVAFLFYFGGEDPFFQGMAVPLALIGLIQFIVGATVYRRSDADIGRVKSMLDYQQAGLKELELPRMLQVQRNFVTLRWVEIVLFITGTVLFFLHTPDATDPEMSKNIFFWKGFGAGLGLQALLCLLLDFFAEKRAGAYTGKLKQFVASIK